MKFGPYLKTHIHINFYKLGKPSGYCSPALRLTNLHFAEITSKAYGL